MQYSVSGGMARVYTSCRLWWSSTVNTAPGESTVSGEKDVTSSRVSTSPRLPSAASAVCPALTSRQAPWYTKVAFGF